MRLPRGLLCLALGATGSCAPPTPLPESLGASLGSDGALRVVVTRVDLNGVRDVVVLREDAPGAWSASSLTGLNPTDAWGYGTQTPFVATDATGREYANLGTELRTRVAGGSWGTVSRAPGINAAAYRAAFLGSDGVLRVLGQGGGLYELQGAQMTTEFRLGSGGSGETWAPSGPRAGELVAWSAGPTMAVYGVDCTSGTCASQLEQRSDLGAVTGTELGALRTRNGALLVPRVGSTLQVDGGNLHVIVAASVPVDYPTVAFSQAGDDGVALALSTNQTQLALWVIDGDGSVHPVMLQAPATLSSRLSLVSRVRGGDEEFHLFATGPRREALEHFTVLRSTWQARSETLALP